MWIKLGINYIMEYTMGCTCCFLRQRVLLFNIEQVYLLFFNTQNNSHQLRESHVTLGIFPIAGWPVFSVMYVAMSISEPL